MRPYPNLDGGWRALRTSLHPVLPHDGKRALALNRTALFVSGLVVGGVAGFGIGHFEASRPATSTSSQSAGMVASSPQVVRCTEEKNGLATDTSPDDRWVKVSNTEKTFESTHGKFFFAESNTECVIIAVPEKSSS